MSDYIRREDAKAVLQEKVFRNLTDEFYGAMQVIDEMPSADVVQMRHGRWTHKPNIYGVAYCSECDYELRINNASYCPNCGAKMERSEPDGT